MFDKKFTNSKAEIAYNYGINVEEDPFYNEVKYNNDNIRQFENLSNINYHQRMPTDSEMLRIKIIQKELDEKKVKIEIGSKEIYNPKLNEKTKNNNLGLASNYAKKRGIFKSNLRKKNEEKGKLLTVNDYKERFI